MLIINKTDAEVIDKVLSQHNTLSIIYQERGEREINNWLLLASRVKQQQSNYIYLSSLKYV